MKTRISAIAYHLPDTVEGVDTLKRDNPDWDVEKITEKTGVRERHISAIDETALDLACAAGEKLLAQVSGRETIDLVLLVTQSPDYVLPNGACILQDRLQIAKSSMAFDVNLGCSGFVYALSIAGGLIESGIVRRGMIVCADTYSKYIGKNDRTCRPLFSDGAAAILIEKSETDDVGPFEFGTDGSGYDRLIVRRSGSRDAGEAGTCNRGELEMQGSDVFLFTMRVVPPCIARVLERAGCTLQDIDLFVFHQASKLVIDNLIRHLSLDKDKVFVNYETVGNTVSASIPIALKDAAAQGRLKQGDRVLLAGFGVGLSWGAVVIRWAEI